MDICPQDNLFTLFGGKNMLANNPQTLTFAKIGFMVTT